MCRCCARLAALLRSDSRVARAIMATHWGRAPNGAVYATALFELGLVDWRQGPRTRSWTRRPAPSTIDAGLWRECLRYFVVIMPKVQTDYERVLLHDPRMLRLEEMHLPVDKAPNRADLGPLTGALRHNSTLVSLSMYTKCGDKGLLQLAELLSVNRTLEAIAIADATISDRGALPLLEQVFHPDSRIIDFSIGGHEMGQAALSAEFFRRFAELYDDGRRGVLEVVQISDCPFSDEVCAILADHVIAPRHRRNQPSLACFAMYGAAITEAGLLLLLEAAADVDARKIDKFGAFVEGMSGHLSMQFVQRLGQLLHGLSLLTGAFLCHRSIEGDREGGCLFDYEQVAEDFFRAPSQVARFPPEFFDTDKIKI